MVATFASMARSSKSILLFVLAIACLGLVASPFACFAVDILFEEPGPKDPPAVMRQAQQLYDSILSFRREHGRYPKSLAEIGVEEDSIGWGGWDYDRYWFSDGFELKLGNYDRYHFVLWRDHDDPEWNLDS